ncbi:hypothetical protein JoomaDRAFT_3843 [Galbibacter orientalis DSM 19592]|uniref:Uncharacterized protein n=1 Tax=Galbibacter orientalis DSM 19592 TaxID=926559 RepID=I3CAY0_9FLAO|nr:hypothetical protein [Galbibacter orientalis]EIJ40773.1 hypothetical protein JoomaDRAFT_3843 [Galbibacter orientalis DSM 19592]
MKNKLYLLVFIIMLVIACSRDEYDEPNSFSDVSWYTSGFRDSILNVNINDYASFSDLSQGVVSHKWTIEDGNYYLKGPITNKDSIYDKFIIEPAVLETDDKTVHVLFKKGGIQKVNLYNVFDQYVEFKGADDFVFKSKEVDGRWVIDTTFLVDVYDTIVPKILIRQDGNIISHESDSDVITVEAGSAVEFVDVSTVGRPNTRLWQIAGETNSDSLATIQFNKLGEFKGSLNLSRTGENVPADFEKYNIPATVKVIPSSLPFEVSGAVTESESQIIQVPFNGEFESFSGQESHFSVIVNDSPFTIASVKVNTNDGTMLDIKLTDQIYRSDVITVSYDGEGSLISTDTRSAVGFSDLPVNMFQHEVIKFDFESGALNFVPKVNENLSTTIISSSTEQAASGTMSLKVDAPVAGNFSAFINYEDTFHLEAGVPVQYEYKLYKVDGAAIPFMAPWINRGGDETVTQFWHNDIASVPSNTWVTIRVAKKWEAANTADDYNVYVRHGGKGVIYIDDLRIIEVDERP